MSEQRNRELQEYHRLLGQETGQHLMEELADIWDPYSLLGDTAEKTAYNCGLRDAFKFLKDLQTGAMIRDE